MVVYQEKPQLAFPAPRLDKLMTTLSQAERQGRYGLSARLARRFARQHSQSGQYEVAFHWFAKSLQFYRLQGTLGVAYWETLHDWLGMALLLGKTHEVEVLLEQPPRADLSLCTESPCTQSSCTESPQLELRFLGAISSRLNDQPQTLRPRFAEFLVVLANNPQGLTSEQLTLAVYGENGEVSCCKTELSRLKQLFPLASRPYRLDALVWADFLELPVLLKNGRIGEAIDLYAGPLLPSSEAPEVCNLRRSLEETLRAATIECGSGEDLWKLGSRIHDDLELWEAMATRLLQGDPRRGMARAHVHSLRRSWEI